MIQRLRKTLLFAAFIFSLSQLNAQAGIYDESDIEVQDLFLKAQLEKQKSNYDEVIKVLKEITKREPGADAAYYELARAYVAKEDLELAEKNAKKAVNLNSSNEWYTYLLAEIYENSEQYGKAAEMFSKLIGINDRNDISYHRLSYNLLKDGQVNNAIAKLEELQAKRGVNEETARRLFDIHKNLGQEEAAENALRKLIEAYPESARLKNNLASYLHQIGKKEQALILFKEVLEIDPENNVANLAVTREGDDLSQVNGGSLSQVEQIISNENISLDDKIIELMPLISTMQKNAPETKDLIRFGQMLKDQYPNSAKIYAVNADILFYAAQFIQAEKNYSKAIELDDTKYSLWDQWMINAWQLQDFDKLQEISTDAVDFFPNEVNAYLFYAIANHIMKGDSEETREYLEEAQLIAGNNAILKTNARIVRLWVQKEDTDNQSLQDQMSSINDSNLSNPVLFEFLGDIYFKLSNSEKSKNFWRKAVNYGADEKRLNKKIGA